jgi:hypothetical protein
MRVRTSFFLAIVASVLFSGAERAAAERITLKNGYEIEGWIVEESKAEIVLAIIKGGAVGKITIDPADVDRIDRTRKESIEEALARYRREQAEAARLALPQPAAPAASKEPAAAAPAKGGEEPAVLPEPTREEEEKIRAAIDAIGDTRHAGGAATRRDNARKELVAIGLPAVPALTEAVGDSNWYRRMNAARAIAGIAAGGERKLGYWKEAAPRLIETLGDSVPFVRAAANEALEAISGTNVNYPEPRAGEPSAEEQAAIERWAQWWESVRKDIKG